MSDLKAMIDSCDFGMESVCAIEVDTYRKQWSTVTFFAKEKNGHPQKNFLPVRSGEFLEQQFNCAAGLLDIGVRRGDFVSVYSSNSLRHVIEIYAILSIGAVYVPIYPTLTEDEVFYILSHSGSRVLIAGGLGQYQRAYNVFTRVKSPLRNLIVDFPLDSPGENVLTYENLQRVGERANRTEEVLSLIKGTARNDLAALVYTPGTTGIPKAAMLTHGNFIAQAPLAGLFDITSKDVRHSHLPFSHVFGLSSDLFASALIGSKIAISRSFDTEEIISDIEEIRPTVMCSVPRIYEKLFMHVIEVINRFGSVKKFFYTVALNAGKDYYIRKVNGKPIPFPVKLLRGLLSPVFGKIRKIISMERMRVLFSGGGPLNVAVSYFFGSIGLEILEGYGLTETSPVINVNIPGKCRPGTVGPPIEGAEEKISDEGEILVRGPMVCAGYYDYRGEDAGDFFSTEGFFRTGDVGMFTSDGCLMITGRMKDLIITSGGKNIAPLPLESKFTADEYIDNFCIVGDKRKYLSALVVPNFDRLRDYAKSCHIVFETDEDLVRNSDIIEFMKSRIDAVSDHLARYEQIKKFTLLPHSFSVETGELTLTYKFKRRAIQDKYRDVIDMMYPESSLL